MNLVHGDSDVSKSDAHRFDDDIDTLSVGDLSDLDELSISELSSCPSEECVRDDGVEEENTKKCHDTDIHSSRKSSVSVAPENRLAFLSNPAGENVHKCREVDSQCEDDFQAKAAVSEENESETISTSAAFTVATRALRPHSTTSEKSNPSGNIDSGTPYLLGSSDTGASHHETSAENTSASDTLALASAVQSKASPVFVSAEKSVENTLPTETSSDQAVGVPQGSSQVIVNTASLESAGSVAERKCVSKTDEAFANCASVSDNVVSALHVCSHDDAHTDTERALNKGASVSTSDHDVLVTTIQKEVSLCENSEAPKNGGDSAADIMDSKTIEMSNDASGNGDTRSFSIGGDQLSFFPVRRRIFRVGAMVLSCILCFAGL